MQVSLANLRQFSHQRTFEKFCCKNLDRKSLSLLRSNYCTMETCSLLVG